MFSFFRQFTAAAVSAVMTVSTFAAFPTFAADDETAKTEVKITFQLPEGATPGTDDDGNPYVYDDIITEPNSSVFIPLGKPEMQGGTFSAWTADGVYAYEPNDVFRVGTEDVTLVPAFYYSADKTYYQFKYEVEVGGEIVDTSELLGSYKYKKNRLIVPSLTAIMNPEARQIGWTDGEHKFLPEQKFLMPEHDVTLKPILHYYHTISYVTGDVDGIIGANVVEYTTQEGAFKDLPQYDRFSRIGYNIVGWHNEYDGKDYSALDAYEMPDSDVVFTAIWEPINYNVVFNHSVTGSTHIKIRGLTGTSIKVPEPTAKVEGKTFGGWSYEGKIYQPGEEFPVEGAPRGVGIMLKAVWNDGTTGDTDTTTVSSTAVVTTTSVTSLSTTTTTVTSATTAPLNKKRYEFSDIISSVDEKSVTFASNGLFAVEENADNPFSDYKAGDVVSVSLICSENDKQFPVIFSVESIDKAEAVKSIYSFSDRITEIGVNYISFANRGKYVTFFDAASKEAMSAYKVGDLIDIAFESLESDCIYGRNITKIDYVDKSSDDAYKVQFINIETGKPLEKGNVHFKLKVSLSKGEPIPFKTELFLKYDLSKENPAKINYSQFMDDPSEYEYSFRLSEFECDDDTISFDRTELNDNFAVVYCSVLEETPSVNYINKVYVKDADTKEDFEKDLKIQYFLTITYDLGDGHPFYSGPIETIDYSKGKECVIDITQYQKDIEKGICTLSFGPFSCADKNYSIVKTDTDEDGTIIFYVRSNEGMLYGDANVDGEINLADVVLIMQSLTNPDKYGLNGSDPSHITAQGLKNADVVGNDGVTNNDALSIQKYKLSLISSLPEV